MKTASTVNEEIKTPSSSNIIENDDDCSSEDMNILPLPKKKTTDIPINSPKSSSIERNKDRIDHHSRSRSHSYKDNSKRRVSRFGDRERDDSRDDRNNDQENEKVKIEHEKDQDLDREKDRDSRDRDSRDRKRERDHSPSFLLLLCFSFLICFLMKSLLVLFCITNILYLC